ncbi:MAG: DUF2269 domain-containing protein [Nitrospinae bacterium]|nr:DUF2269 domain-containing protein [Nitrospinota bacterium]MBI3813080.1 DUF2269 domain-containing protein [Nitrospinota bacterium]
MNKDLQLVVKWTIGMYSGGLLIALPLFMGYEYPMPISYEWLKTIHIFGVILFMGNIITGPLWIAHAMRSKNNAVVCNAIKALCWADVFFTIPGVVLTLISGLILASSFGDYYTVSWIITALILLGISSIPAIPTLRYQYRLYQLSYEALQQDKPLPEEFTHIMGKWSLLGTIAIILPLISFVLMIIKPALW